MQNVGYAAQTRGKHKTKNSDLKLAFGTCSQNNPLYYHDANQANQIIRGFRSPILKFSNPICNYCNSERTQPHNRAWGFMSLWFRQHIITMKPGNIIRANKIYPFDTRQRMLNVHLYFVKLFGCTLLETAGKVSLKLNLCQCYLEGPRASRCIFALCSRSSNNRRV